LISPPSIHLHNITELTMKTFGIIISALLLGAFSTAAFAATPVPQAYGHRTDLQHQDLSIPGREAVQVRVDIDPGKSAPKHKHPGEEVIYVLEGTLEYQIEDQPPVTLKAGDVFFIPAGAAHSAKNIGEGNGAELATYIVEKGRPLAELVK
jgi:quercetin dioxygenase-like cupin family protein